jgi:hypothetical protein
MRALLDEHAPTRNATITIRPDCPWFNYDIREARRKSRNLEKLWQRSKLTVHMQMFHQARNALTKVRRDAKIAYFADKIDSASSPKELSIITNSLLQKQKTSPLPSLSCLPTLAEKFSEFFTTKITNIRSGITSTAASTPTANPPVPSVPLQSFMAATDEEVSTLVKKSPCKTSPQDPIPSWLVKKCAPSIVPVLTCIINKSLASGEVPTSMKEAIVKPLLKKPSLDREKMANYRPVSNLTYLSKLLERVVAHRIQEHCSTNRISNKFQSAYKQYHSTETALLRVHNDVLHAVDSDGGAILVLLDLSAAFDTLDHQMLLDHLHHRLAICDTALQWFASYLNGRKQCVRVGDATSSPSLLQYGVPQGSVLGPLLFTLYTHPLADVIAQHNLDYHLYADDTQLYIAFSRHASAANNAITSVNKMESAVNDIKAWMDSHYLKLNEAKTEVLIIQHPSPRAPPVQLPSLRICDHDISHTSHVRDLGVTFDSSFGVEQHVSNVCRAAYLHIHNIWRIRKFITESSARALVQAHVVSRLDYCNSLFFGLSVSTRSKLQRVQNAAARLVTRTRKYHHITPVLMKLHWLPVEHRVRYKIELLTFKALHGLAPPYIEELVFRYMPARRLRSMDANLLTTGNCRLQSVGGKAFSVTAPKLWNSLPGEIRSCDSLCTFKSLLKTYHFKLAFK